MATKEEARGGVVSWLLGKLFGGLLALVKTWGVTLLWLLLLLLVFANVDKPLVFVALLAVVVGLAVVLWFLPGGRGRWSVPFYGDFKKWRHRKAEDHARTLGHHYSVALGVVEPIPDALTSWAFAKPQKRLPGGVVRATDDGCTLRAVQTIPATDEQILKKAEAFAPTIGMIAELTTVERPAHSQVLVRWRRTPPVDLLAAAVPFEPTPYAVPDAVTIGRDAAGAPFKLNLWDNQTLALGSSGSGKGSIVWATMLGLAPAIKARQVRVHAIDMKGGVEALIGAPLFASIATTYEEAAALIAGLRAEVDERLAVMVANGERKHTPTVEQPAILLLCDEYASLVYSAPDNKAKAAVEQDLKRILSVGRATRAGHLLALAQDPRVESILARQLFTQVIGLRFRTVDDARLALGAATVDAGAACHLIPQNQQGTFFAISESGEVQKARAFWCDDETIRARAAAYAAPKVVEADV